MPLLIDKGHNHQLQRSIPFEAGGSLLQGLQELCLSYTSCSGENQREKPEHPVAPLLTPSITFHLSADLQHFCSRPVSFIVEVGGHEIGGEEENL